MKDINFFSSYIDVQKNSKKNSLFWGVLIAFILIFTIGFYSWYYLTSKYLSDEIDELDNFINSEETIKNINEINTLQNKYKLLNEYYDIVKIIDNNIYSKDIINEQFLANISRQVPDDTYFTAISITQEEMQIQGISKNRTSVAELEYNLKLLNNIKEVHVSNISGNLEENNGYVFSMTCLLEGDKNEVN